MPPTLTKPDASQPALWESLRGVEIFSAGNHDGHPLGAITEADLDAAARNFAEGVCDVPLWAGHEADISNTGLPAFGWMTGVRRRGDRLVADFDFVPPPVADAIRRRRYRKVSAEFYTPEKTGLGYVLKRVGVLGSHQPADKSLAPLPDPEPPRAHWPATIKAVARNFCEDGSVRIFSEVHPMTRAELEKRLLELGGTPEDVEAFRPVPDDALAGYITRREKRQAGPPAQPPVPPPAVVTGGVVTHPAVPTPAPAPAATPPVPPPAGALAATAQLARQFSEMEGRLQAAERMTRDREANERKRLVDGFCERMVAEGRLTPAQVEPGKGPARLALENADAVRRFSDDTPSEMERLMKAFEANEPRRFNERLRDPARRDEFAALDAEVDAFSARRNKAPARA